MTEEQGVQILKKRTFRTFKYRGYELEKLMELPIEQLIELLPARQRRKFSRGVKRQSVTLLNKLRAAKKDVPYGQKPEPVKTHLRDMIIIPEMIGSIVGVYNGKQYINVEIKPEMVGYYLGEFSITYKPVRHGKPGIGATHSSRFIPLK
ncbi:40S ribosomal protein S15 [Theileria orientalis]|uniref:40S ribosomal protein S15 n=1 Tax=Theileria orientalis TaxID=68886 RepID=A0A976M6E2_THEOR|nr:40S ribosomal protein S15 [Theileria orientalis]